MWLTAKIRNLFHNNWISINSDLEQMQYYAIMIVLCIHKNDEMILICLWPHSLNNIEEKKGRIVTGRWQQNRTTYNCVSCVLMCVCVKKFHSIIFCAIYLVIFFLLHIYNPTITYRPSCVFLCFCVWCWRKVIKLFLFLGKI